MNSNCVKNLVDVFDFRLRVKQLSQSLVDVVVIHKLRKSDYNKIIFLALRKPILDVNATISCCQVVRLLSKKTE